MKSYQILPGTKQRNNKGDEMEGISNAGIEFNEYAINCSQDILKVVMHS
jgi:hypothetical protein